MESKTDAEKQKTQVARRKEGWKEGRETERRSCGFADPRSSDRSPTHERGVNWRNEEKELCLSWSRAAWLLVLRHRRPPA